jgi:hypothetical protein
MIEIAAGRCYEDTEGLDRYVVSIAPASGRHMARIRWRRPGRHATKIDDQTEAAFRREVRKENPDGTVDPAPALYNDGLAAL